MRLQSLLSKHSNRLIFGRKFRLGLFFVCLFILLCVGFLLPRIFSLFPVEKSMEELGIERIIASCDRNKNGQDDYTDFLLGARKDAENHPKYDGKYWADGYPPENIGVCTDVIWRAFRAGGYSLRDMVDRDIALYPEDYPDASVRDRNIDFRRVKNLRIFFDKYAVPLTTDISDLAAWQPGDIVIFGDDTHIGIVSDRRGRTGYCYIIHNGGQPKREEEYLLYAEPTGHYRFDAAEVPDEILVSWVEPEKS